MEYLEYCKKRAKQIVSLGGTSIDLNLYEGADSFLSDDFVSNKSILFLQKTTESWWEHVNHPKYYILLFKDFLIAKQQDHLDLSDFFKFKELLQKTILVIINELHSRKYINYYDNASLAVLALNQYFDTKDKSKHMNKKLFMKNILVKCFNEVPTQPIGLNAFGNVYSFVYMLFNEIFFDVPFENFDIATIVTTDDISKNFNKKVAARIRKDIKIPDFGEFLELVSYYSLNPKKTTEVETKTKTEMNE